MDFRILGGVVVAEDARPGSAEIAVPGVRLRTLLCLLLVRRGETIRSDRLADDLWGASIPAGYQNALQSLVSKLRRALGSHGRLLVTDGDGYRFDVPPSDIDAHRFEIGARDGHDLLVAGDAVGAAATLATALDLWRGPALAGMTDDGILQREAVRLDELHLTALEDRIDADLQIGRHAELIGELSALAREHPLRERFHGFLMVALYRSGRQADALRAYQDARSLLGDELGLDPGPELRALEASILAQDPALDLAPVAAGGSRLQSNLVAGLSSFVGRDEDVVSLAGTLERHRLVTVTGPGGAGKTRLSLETAARRTDREDVWMVELAPLSDASSVAGAIANTLGTMDGVGRAGQPIPVDERIVEHLADRPTLIVLDNCEHLIGEAARVAEKLLRACPSLTILATSREALGVSGEAIWTMPSMSMIDAVALFADRAGAASGFELTAENEPIVVELCTRLDGLPLAIELAAGRSRAFPVQQLASRLDDRFRLLTGGARTALPRHQTLRAVVEWSYDLLFEHEQKVFDRLSVFAGGCSLDAAEAVCAGPDVDVADVADVLGHLVDKSLVIADRSGGEVRFRLLQTLALFGRERLAASPDAAEARSRHATHFADLCARGHAAFRGHLQEPWLTEVERDVDNLHVALNWRIDQHDAEAAQTMLGGLGWSWWFAGRGDDGWRWITAGLNCQGPTTPQARAHAAIWACYVALSAGAGYGQQAVAYGYESIELFRECGDNDGLLIAVTLMADVMATSGNVPAMIELNDEAERLGATLHDDWSRAITINASGRIAEMKGELERAEALMRDSLVYFERLGVDWAIAIVGGNIALIAERRGNIDEAIEVCERAKQAAIDLRLGGYEAMMLARLGLLMLWKGEWDRADQLLRESLALADETRYNSAKALASAWQGVAHRIAGRWDEAVESCTTALALLRLTGLTSGISRVLSTLGLLAEYRGDLAAATEFHLEALSMSEGFSDGRHSALALEGLAGVSTSSGDGLRAAMLLGAAQAQREAAGGALSGPLSDAERITRQTIELIGKAAFDEAFATGNAARVETLLPA